MIVGFDLDGVVYPCAETLETWLVSQGLFMPGQLPKPTRWRHYDEWGMTNNEYWQHFREAVESGFMFRYGNPLPGSLEAVDQIKAAGHKIVFVTARRADAVTRRSTLAWLDDWEFPWDGLVFSNDKAVLSCDLFIDDKAANVEGLRTAGVEAWLLNTYEADADHPHVVTWAQFLEKVERHV